MTRRRPHRPALRAVATFGAAAALCGLSATSSHALGLPEPVSTAVGGVGSAVTGAAGGLGLPVPGSTTTPSGSTSAPASGPSTSGSSSTSTAGQGTGKPGSGSSAPTTSSGAGAKGSAPANGAVVDSPAATVCLIPTGGSSPAVEVDLKAAGVDLSSPLVKQFPQALAPCPAGAVPAGDHVLSVDAAVEGLLGACVRVTRQVVPVQTTLVVLDHDVISELTKAGVPLQQLVVPCPKGAGTAPGGQSPSSTTPVGHTTPGRPGAASALPDGLAFTGSDPVPMTVLGIGLLWFGVLLTRGARAAVSAGAARG